MSAETIALCVRLGLLSPCPDGSYEITGVGRILARVPPPQPRRESHAQWWARVSDSLR